MLEKRTLFPCVNCTTAPPTEALLPCRLKQLENESLCKMATSYLMHHTTGLLQR